jgi:hypothetical protein
VRAAVALLKNNWPVKDSLLLQLAANKEWRLLLYNKLKDAQKTKFFPAAYRTQLHMAEGLMAQQFNVRRELDSLKFCYSVLTTLQGQHGRVFAFTYKLKKEESWKMGFCGLLPADSNHLNLQTKWVNITEKTIKPDKPELQQLQEQLSKLLFKQQKSAARFSVENGSRNVFTIEED